MSTESGRLLLVDDDESFGRILASQLELFGHHVSVMTDGVKALAAYDDVAPEVAIVDIWMSGLDGMQLLTEIRRRDAAASVIMLSGDVDVRLTVRALRRRGGCANQARRPRPPDRRHRPRVAALAPDACAPWRAPRVERSVRVLRRLPPMRRVTRLVEHLSQNTTPVLIVGESGTGKGVVAEMLHQLSPRAGQPFVRVDCASHDADDAYDALVGARTPGGGKHGRGLLAMAAGGTLFLDNVGALASRMQDLLSGLLMDATPEQPGSAQRVRVVAATARDLAEDWRAAACAMRSTSGSRCSRWRCRPSAAAAREPSAALRSAACTHNASRSAAVRSAFRRRRTRSLRPWHGRETCDNCGR